MFHRKSVKNLIRSRKISKIDLNSSANETDSMMSGSETEIENEDLSEVRAGSAILPNLTIAIERDDDPGFEIWFVLFFLEIDSKKLQSHNCDFSFIKLKGTVDDKAESGVVVVRNNQKLQRINEEEWNLARGIPVLGLGIDKHSPKQLKKQKDRAKRFGLDINKNMEDGEIDENEINKVS